MISPYSQQIDRMYRHLADSEGCRSVALVAGCGGDGVSTLALALAQRCLHEGRRTLLVDMNTVDPCSRTVMALGSANNKAPVASLIGFEHSDAAITGISTVENERARINLRRDGTLRAYIEMWKQQFDVIVFDTNAMEHDEITDIRAERVARACDQTLLVVRANHTSEDQVLAMTRKLDRCGATLSGMVINDRSMPRLKEELKRAVHRIDGFMPWLHDRLISMIDRSRLLDLEI